MPTRTRIFLIEDRPGLLDEVERLLRARPYIEVVGRCLSGENAVAEVATRTAELVLMDLDSGMAGIEAIADLKTLPNAPRIIILGEHDHPHFHAAVKALGAQASLDRRKVATLLLPLIEQVKVTQTGFVFPSANGMRTDLSSRPQKTVTRQESKS